MQSMPALSSITCCLPHRRRALNASTLLLLAVTIGCGPGGPLHWELGPRVAHPDPAAVIFLVDGLPPDYVAQGCAAGWLPNIQTRFRAAGLEVRNASAALPCITYAAINTLLTGVEPAEHGILGNRWFDPEQALFRDYATIPTYRLVNGDSDAPTLYERSAPAPSASIQAAHHRGVTFNIANWAVSGVMWFFGNYTAVDKLTASSTIAVARWASSQNRWPSVVTYYMPGADSVAHLHGVDSPEFRTAITHVDYQIGRVCDWLASQGLLETTYIVLLSDHGHVPVSPGGFVDLLPLVRDTWGRNVTDHMLQDGSDARRRAFYDRFDTVLNQQDGRRASIHFRSAQGWRIPPTPGQVAAILAAVEEAEPLWNQPGIQCVAYLEDDDTAVVRNHAGVARIREIPGPDGPLYAYIIESADVLGYQTRIPGHAAAADPHPNPAPSTGLRSGSNAGVSAPDLAEPRADRDWLELAATADAPDVVSRLIPLLRNRRAGQVVAFAAPGYSFVPENGGHGGLHRNEARFTWLMAGPGIEPGTEVFAARAVDVLPTLLHVLERPEQAAGLPGHPLPGLAGVDRVPVLSETSTAQR